MLTRIYPVLFGSLLVIVTVLILAQFSTCAGDRYSLVPKNEWAAVYDRMDSLKTVNLQLQRQVAATQNTLDRYLAASDSLHRQEMQILIRINAGSERGKQYIEQTLEKLKNMENRRKSVHSAAKTLLLKKRE